MANSNEKQKKTTAVKQELNGESAIPPITPKNKSLMATGAFVIALGSLAATLYTLSLNQQLQSQLTDKNTQLAIQLEKLEQKQDSSQEQIDAKTNALEKVRDALQEKFDELNKQLQAAMSQKFYQNQNWLLLKVRYYLELAQINAHWSKSFNATSALLQQADQLLQQLNDPKVFEIRQAIAKDIAQLQAMPVIDITGILSQLDAAQNSLKDLNVASVLSESQPQTAAAPEPSKGATPVWRIHLQDSMNVLSKLVVIRRNDELIKPLMSPAFESLLKENIRLNLQEAQWAVLNSNPEVYQLVLKQAITTLKKNFNEGAQNTSALIKKLDELQQIQLIQKSPNIGTALPLLNQLINAKEPVVPQSDNNSQGGDSQ